MKAQDSIAQPVEAVADFVVSEPPVGLRLNRPFRIDGFSETIDGDLAVIDVALRALRPGGRAVLHLPVAWTYRGGIAERFRTHLLESSRVVAIIGLPAGGYAMTSIPSVLLVVDRHPGSGETFVAQLGDDWPHQLSQGGPALTEFYAQTPSPQP